MDRGFTLIEMLISLIVLAVLLSTAIPSFSGLNEKLKMQRLAGELQAFFMQAKSEAVLRNQHVYLHFIQDGELDSGEWALIISDSLTIPQNRNVAKKNTLMYLDGSPFKGVSIHLPTLVLRFDGVNGKPNQNGNIAFSIGAKKSLVFKFHTRSRYRVCGDDEGELYGFPSC